MEISVGISPFGLNDEMVVLRNLQLVKGDLRSTFSMFLWGPQPPGEALVWSPFHFMQKLRGIGER